MLAACCGFCAGPFGMCLNCTGIFYSVMADSLGVGRGTIAMSATLTTLLAGLGSPVFVLLTRKMKLRPLLACGLLLTAGSTALMAAVRGIGVFYFLSVVRGIGVACFANGAIALLLNNWFLERNGFVTGLAFCFSGVGGAVFNPLLSRCIKTVGWRGAYLVMAAGIAFLALPGILFVVYLNPWQKGLLPYGMKETEKTDCHPEVKETVQAGEKTVQSVFLEPAFWFASCFTLLACCITGMGQHLTGYGNSVHLSAAVSVAMVSASMIGNIVWKLLIGVLSDAVGIQKACISFLFVTAAALLGLFWLPGDGTVLPVLIAFLFGTCYAVGAVGTPLVTRAITSGEQYHQAIGVTSLLSNVGGAVPLAIIGFLYDAFGNYRIAIVSCAVCALFCVLLLILTGLVCKRKS